MTHDADDLPNPIDRHVGGRMRLRRKLLGRSQQRLAEAVGVTFQQIQKYERGTNRISASKLYAIAVALEVSVTFFFEGLDEIAGEDLAAGGGQVADLKAFLISDEGFDWAKAVLAIRPARLRRKLLQVVLAMAAPDA